MTVSMKSGVFWDVAPCSLVEVHCCFGGMTPKMETGCFSEMSMNISSFLNWIVFLYMMMSPRD